MTRTYASFTPTQNGLPLRLGGNNAAFGMIPATAISGFASGGSFGSVTSVMASGPAGLMTWSSGPIIGSGVLFGVLDQQQPNTFLAGPYSGSASGTPSFRSMVPADAPFFVASGTAILSGTGVKGVGASGPVGIFSWTSPVTQSGSLTASLVNQNAALVLASPVSGASAAAPTFRALNTGDVPAAAVVTVANEGTDTTCFPLFSTAATGDLGPKTNAGLAFNSNTVALTCTTFVGALTGNAATATALATGRAINGVTFDGTAPITVTAAAGTLTGTTLASNVVASSLTSVGILTSLAVVVDDSGATTTPTAVTIGHNTSSTAAAGFGSVVKWQLETPSTADTDAAALTVTWAALVTHAARKARVVLSVYDTAAREILVGEASGSAPKIGFLGAAASLALASPDLGTLATTFGLATGTPTFATANLSGLGTGVADFLATPSSANLAAAVTGETGTGALVFGTSPTITTGMTCPLLIGGTGTTDDLIFRTTSGSGTTGADFIWQGGTNGGTELMRLLNAGYLGIGTATPTSPLEIWIANTDSLTWQEWARIGVVTWTWATGGSGHGADLVLTNDAGGYLRLDATRVGIGMNPAVQFELSGSVGQKASGTTWANPSDSRLKDNVKDFKDGLDVVRKIRPVSYELNGLAGTPKGTKGVSVIAQEIAKVAPYMVGSYKAKLRSDDKDDDDILNFDASALTFILVNAIKEQQATIESLTERIAALEKKPK